MVRPMNHDSYSDDHIRGVLRSVTSVAVVGASPKEVRPSYFVVRYLMQKGFRVFPINPGQDGKTLLGRTIYATLADVPEPIDMVDVFRSAEHAPRIVEEALALDPRPKVIWMQLGVRNDEAAAVAEAAGLTVIMNRCPKIEYGRLSGEIGWSGVNTRVLSAKKPTLATGYHARGLGSK